MSVTVSVAIIRNTVSWQGPVVVAVVVVGGRQ